MTSHCDVANPTKHLESKLDRSKVGQFAAWPKYDEIAAASSTNESKNMSALAAPKTQQTAAMSKTAFTQKPVVQSALLQYTIAAERGSAVSTLDIKDRKHSQLTGGGGPAAIESSGPARSSTGLHPTV